MTDISIIMPTRDDGTAVEATLRSLRQQNQVTWELVVVDGGSVDGSADRLRRLMLQDERIRARFLPEDAVVDAIFDALPVVSAATISIVPPGTLFEPNALMRLVADMHLGGSCACIGEIGIATERQTLALMDEPLPAAPVVDDIVGMSLLRPVLCAIRRADLLHRSVDRALGWCAMRALMVQLASDGTSWRRVSGVLATQRVEHDVTSESIVESGHRALRFANISAARSDAMCARVALDYATCRALTDSPARALAWMSTMCQVERIDSIDAVAAARRAVLHMLQCWPVQSGERPSGWGDRLIAWWDVCVEADIMSPEAEEFARAMLKSDRGLRFAVMSSAAHRTAG
ncbi:MAG: glycosyltransferase [Planctomycetota bacterium]